MSPDEARNMNTRKDDSTSKSPLERVPVQISNDSAANQVFQWQSDIEMPLQTFERSNAIAGVNFYDGLPVMFSLDIPASMKPTLEVELRDNHPNEDGTSFPGGSVFETLQIELEATHDWIWLSIKRRE